MTTAIFPGSFDPFHNGHHEVVDRLVLDIVRARLCIAIPWSYRHLLPVQIPTALKRYTGFPAKFAVATRQIGAHP